MIWNVTLLIVMSFFWFCNFLLAFLFRCLHLLMVKKYKPNTVIQFLHHIPENEMNDFINEKNNLGQVCKYFSFYPETFCGENAKQYRVVDFILIMVLNRQFK